MNYDKVIGIDVGLSGGIAVFWKDQIETVRMPSYQKTLKSGKKRNLTDVLQIKQILEQQKEGYNPIIFIELVQGWLSDASDNAGKAFQIQKMLANYEALKAVITVTDIPFVEVRPQDWQSYLNLKLKGESKKNRKKRYIRFAKSKYFTPVFAWNGDALCIVEFGRRKLQHDPAWVKESIH